MYNNVLHFLSEFSILTDLPDKTSDVKPLPYVCLHFTDQTIDVCSLLPSSVKLLKIMEINPLLQKEIITVLLCYHYV